MLTDTELALSILKKMEIKTGDKIFLIAAREHLMKDLVVSDNMAVNGTVGASPVMSTYHNDKRGSNGVADIYVVVML